MSIISSGILTGGGDGGGGGGDPAVAAAAAAALAAAQIAQGVANAAKSTADGLASAVSDASTDAGDAKTAADEAKTTAGNAATAASTAQTKAQEAKDAVDGAVTAAGTATTAAGVAKTAAETAQTTAEAAQTAAGTAQTTANAAKTAAETAQTTAEAAQTAAGTAQTAANEAKTAAGTAQTAAESAASDAGTALSNAGSAAQDAANAQKAADDAQVSADEASGAAFNALGSYLDEPDPYDADVIVRPAKVFLRQPSHVPVSAPCYLSAGYDSEETSCFQLCFNASSPGVWLRTGALSGADETLAAAWGAWGLLNDGALASFRNFGTDPVYEMGNTQYGGHIQAVGTAETGSMRLNGAAPILTYEGTQPEPFAVKLALKKTGLFLSADPSADDWKLVADSAAVASALADAKDYTDAQILAKVTGTFVYRGDIVGFYDTDPTEIQSPFNDDLALKRDGTEKAVYGSEGWSTSASTPEMFDLWLDVSDMHEWYWFHGAWNQLDFQVDLTVKEDAANKTQTLELDPAEASTVKFPSEKAVASALAAVAGDIPDLSGKQDKLASGVGVITRGTSAGETGTLAVDTAVGTGSNLVTNGAVNTALAAKQDKLPEGEGKVVALTAVAGVTTALEIDSAVTASSTKLITSGSVASAIAAIPAPDVSGKQDKLPADEGKVVVLTDTAGVTDALEVDTDADSLATTGALEAAVAAVDLSGKQNKLPAGEGKVVTLTATAGTTGTLEIDSAVTASSAKLITSGAVDAALAAKQAQIPANEGKVLTGTATAGTIGTVEIDGEVDDNDHLVTGAAVKAAVDAAKEYADAQIAASAGGNFNYKGDFVEFYTDSTSELVSFPGSGSFALKADGTAKAEFWRGSEDAGWNETPIVTKAYDLWHNTADGKDYYWLLEQWNLRPDSSAAFEQASLVFNLGSDEVPVMLPQGLKTISIYNTADGSGVGGQLTVRFPSMTIQYADQVSDDPDSPTDMTQYAGMAVVFAILGGASDGGPVLYGLRLGY